MKTCEEPTTTTTRLHLSLDVSDMERSAAFYTALLGSPPVKRRADYAKFLLQDPDLVLTLNAAPGVARGGALSHLGFQVPSPAALEELRGRVQGAGLEIALDEPGVTCCYARQDKFWVTDPDGNAWEFYLFLEDAEEKGAGGAAASSACCPTDVARGDTTC
jgi:catechol 2,3-dioxygenase-like lactoylglutathione lyase family enzyme